MVRIATSCIGRAAAPGRSSTALQMKGNVGEMVWTSFDDGDLRTSIVVGLAHSIVVFTLYLFLMPSAAVIACDLVAKPQTLTL